MSKEADEALEAILALGKGITDLAKAMDNAITILAEAVLELEDPESQRVFLSPRTREAVKQLAQKIEVFEV